MPSSSSIPINNLIAELSAVKTKRAEVNSVAARLKAREDELAGKIMAIMEDSKWTRVEFEGFPVSIEPQEGAKVENWDELYTHILASEEFDLLHRRVNLTACRERWSNKDAVPGVAKTTYSKLKY